MRRSQAINEAQINLKALKKIKEDNFYLIQVPLWPENKWLIGFPKDYSSILIQFAIIAASHNIDDRDIAVEYEKGYGYFSLSNMWGDSYAHVYNMGYNVIADDKTKIKPVETKDFPLYMGEYLHFEFTDIIINEAL